MARKLLELKSEPQRKENAVRIHHLNCISSCPLGGRWIDGLTPTKLQRGHLSCHCLAIETSEGLVLVDTGYGLQDVRNPHSRLSEFFLKTLKPDLREDMTACRQIEKLGYRADDVRHIVLSHLDFDHAGGLDDFPAATVHMMHREIQGAQAQKTWLDRQRFRPQQWSSQERWQSYHAESGESWFGFAKVHALEGLPPEILLLPLIGPTLGHAGVAIQRPEGWLLYAGDAYYYEGEMNVQNPHCTPGLALYQRMMEKDRRSRLWNQNRLRELIKRHGHEVDVFCAHDISEFVRLAERSPDVPVRALPLSDLSCLN